MKHLSLSLVSGFQTDVYQSIFAQIYQILLKSNAISFLIDVDSKKTHVQIYKIVQAIQNKIAILVVMDHVASIN